MRLIFYYPLSARIGHHLRELITFKARSAYRKYQYFIPCFLNHKKRKAAIFLQDSGKLWLYTYIKCLAWMLINKVNPFRVRILKNPSQLDPSQDVLLSFPFLGFNLQKAIQKGSVFHQFPGKKVMHFSHYFDQTSRVCEFLKSLQNVSAVAESNLESNPLYQKWMGSIPCHILPFVLRKRYQNRRDFFSRKPKCLACGTKSRISPSFHKEFYELFRSPYLHRLRGEIYERQEKLKPWMDPLIFDYSESNDKIAKTRLDMWKVWMKKRIGCDRKAFFSFDIVEKYNSYQMFVSPEEESGAASINAIEGMACGCCYLGRAEFYKELNMLPGVHFIGYDGSLEDLIDKISYYQKHPELAAEIAQNGQRFVETSFQQEKVAESFWNWIFGDHVSHSKSKSAQ